MGNEELKLRVCPFCGGEAHVYGDEITCCGCGIVAKSASENMDELVRLWNTRETLDRAVDVSDDQTLTAKEKALMFYRLIKRYNKYKG